MTTVTFDTHLFVRTIQASGIPENQAEAIAEAFRVAQSNAELSTKGDLSELEYRLKSTINESKVDMIKWVAGLMLAQAAVIAALVKLL
ncbi:DUF1640 domain-containing protein [uncultured Thiodictyon sp.]|uniref:DUF1640 domain-containing protein n=1 Tax=uncultured Thiodictyon sp. TaxID=1846217 RepID=UPI0025EDAB7B|nr:DUF1640 domain-containing protein [uncultured Thiodictyon sp.]